MEVKKDGNRLYLEEEGILLGEITYEDDGIFINIDHTFVPSQYGGRGYAKVLLNKLVDYARENNRKVKATCSYAIHNLSKSKEYEDIYVGE